MTFAFKICVEIEKNDLFENVKSLMVKLVKIKIRMLMRVIVTWSSHLAANPGDGSGGKQVVSSSAKMRLHFIAHWEITLLGEF